MTDIDKVVALLREPPEQLMTAAGMYTRALGWRPDARARLHGIADYLEQHARSAPEVEEGPSLSETIAEMRAAPWPAEEQVPEVTEPSRTELIEALAWALPFAEVGLADARALLVQIKTYDREHASRDHARDVLARARRKA